MDTLTCIYYFPNGLKQLEFKRFGNEVFYKNILKKSGQMESLMFISNDSTVNIEYFDNGKIKEKRILIRNENKHYDKEWDEEGRILKDRTYVQIGETDSRNDDHYYVRDEKGQIKEYVYVTPDSTVIATYYVNGKMEFKRLRIIKRKVYNEKLWDKKGRLLKERHFTYDGILISNMEETIYRPDIIKRNPEYKDWKYKIWEL